MTIQIIGIIGKKTIGELVGIPGTVGLVIGDGEVVQLVQIHGGITGIPTKQMIIGGAMTYGILQVIKTINRHQHLHLHPLLNLQTPLQTLQNQLLSMLKTLYK